MKREQKRFSAFRASVRNYPGHRLYKSLMEYDTRTFIVKDQIFWQFYLFCKTCPSAEKIVEKCIDKL